MTEYCYFTVGVPRAQPVRRRQGRIRRHPRPQSTRYALLVAAVHKLLGKKFVFDHHDLSPELYLSRYRTRPKGFDHAWAARCSRSCRSSCADVVIATNESYRAIDIERNGADAGACLHRSQRPGRDACPADGARRSGCAT